MKQGIIIIIIEDQTRFKEDALVWELEDKFEEVLFFTTPEKGLACISDNQQKKMIILLDIDFNRQSRGHEILDKIRKYSELIPVILWSGIDEHKEPFNDFINNHAFGFIKKDEVLETALEIINKAVDYLNTSIDGAIEEWIELQDRDERRKPYLLTAKNGKSYSLEQILYEIRMQTPFGREFAKDLNMLTIDLLLRGKKHF